MFEDLEASQQKGREQKWPLYKLLKMLSLEILIQEVIEGPLRLERIKLKKVLKTLDFSRLPLKAPSKSTENLNSKKGLLNKS